MKNVDYLIIGGSAAGTTAADVIRSIDQNATITIITEEPHEFYSLVLIFNYICRKISREQVFLKKPEWYVQKNIVLLKGVRGQHLEVSKHELTTSDGEVFQYKKLLIAVGGKVIPFAAPGADLVNILYMRTIEDADRIIEASGKAKQGVIIGGGFIGLEFASCMKANGVADVTVLVMEPYFWQGKLDEASSRVLTGVLERNGVHVLTGEEADHFEGGAQVEKVITKSGKEFPAQIVGIGIGTKPDLGWLAGSGLNIGRGIITNEFLETNLPDVYAAGDCAEFADLIFERQHILGNWTNATSQANAVGKTMAGTRTAFGIVSSYSANFFDGSCSFIGETDNKFADLVVGRGSVENGKMTQIYIKTIGGVTRIVGATVINNVIEVAPLAAAIIGKVDVSTVRDNLADTNFDLKNLIS